jgi:hypothetical protein
LRLTRPCFTRRVSAVRSTARMWFAVLGESWARASDIIRSTAVGPTLLSGRWPMAGMMLFSTIPGIAAMSTRGCRAPYLEPVAEVVCDRQPWAGQDGTNVKVSTSSLELRLHLGFSVCLK